MPKTVPEVFREQWRTLRDLTAGMRDAAAGGDWEEVARLDRERQAILAEMPKDAPALDDADSRALQEDVRELVELDREVMGQAVALRDEAAGQVDTVQQGRKAQKAYEENR